MPSDRKAYERAAKKYKRESERLIDRAVKDNVAALRKTRAFIAQEIEARANVENLPLLRRSMRYYFERYGEELSSKVDRQLKRAWDFGKEAVDAPLRKTGHELRLGGLPVKGYESQALQTYRAEVQDTIRGIAADGARRINNAATFGVLGGREKEQITADVGRYVTRGAMKKVASQVESMTRTETARIFNLSMRDRLKQAGKSIGGMKKYWQHVDDGRARPAHDTVGKKTNPDFGGKPVPYDADFRVGGERAFAPFDPRLSDENSYGCRCTLGFFVESE